MDMPQIMENDDIILEIPTSANEELAREIYAEVTDTIELLKPWLPWAKDTYSLKDEMKFLKGQCIERFKDKSGYAYLIRDKKTRQFCGVIDIVRIEEDAKAGEIGYWLAKKMQGRGYMTKAVLLLEKTAFENGFNRMEIRNESENPNSANVAKRAGYHLDGVLRKDRWNPYYKRFADTNVWSKLRSDVE
ncbi:MAG: GNAT family N-acetyltransferase [Alphaproteobacteria bacterium]|nr:GNAT family N-acetyltransferase [Alphaproteobacteria bacterium]